MTKSANNTAANESTTAQPGAKVFSFKDSNNTFKDQLISAGKIGCQVAAAIAPVIVTVAVVEIVASHLARRS